MIPFKFVFVTVVALTFLSGVAAAYLASISQKAPSRARTAERLAQIALVGASALAALLAGYSV